MDGIEAAKEDRNPVLTGDRMLAVLMANVPDGITICDATGNISMVSQHGQALLGEPHAGKSVEEVVSEWTFYRPDGETVMTMQELPLIRALNGETVQNIELVQVNADGRKLPLLCNAAPIRDGAGQVVAAVVAWRDITERRRAEEALREKENRLSRIAKAGRIGFVEWNAAKDTAYWSPEYYELFGIDLESPVPWELWLQGVHPDDREWLAAKTARLLERGRLNGPVRGERDEYRFIRPDGSMVWVESDMSVEMVDGEPIVLGSVPGHHRAQAGRGGPDPRARPAAIGAEQRRPGPPRVSGP